MFYLLLESIFLYGNLDDKTNILVYTSTPFMNIIKKSHLFNAEKVKFEINDTYHDVDKACKSRLDLFELPSSKKYNKVLYLDTDIIVKDDINKVFDVCKEDVLYTLEEGEIDSVGDYWGRTLFGEEVSKYDDKTAFTSGILLFNNCEKIKELFNEIKKDIVNRPYQFGCYDQPFIIYNAFKYNAYNNKVLKSLVINDFYDIHSDKVIHHFPGGPGIYQYKIEYMTNFLNKIKNPYKDFANQIVSNGFTLASQERLENLYNQCKKFSNTNYSFAECGIAKGGCLSMMKFAAGKNNKIFGFDITNVDLDSVYNTFAVLKTSMDNVTLVNGFSQDTLDNTGEIAVLRLDGGWYESTKICLEILYDKVIDGGIIMIGDYGNFIDAKKATDEFRVKHKIMSPLIKTDYTEYYWIKNKDADLLLSDTINIEDDIWTCSSKMRYDIYDFFKQKSHYKIAEIGSHKGYSTGVLSKIFSKVYAVDNSVEWTNFNKNFNKDAVNIEYVMLDIYKDSWEVLPEDIEVSFIDADHSYDGCKSDIMNSIKQFKGLKYIIFDDYGVWLGVKQIIDELISNRTLIFERFIGLNDVPGPHGIVNDTHEGIICSIRDLKDIVSKIDDLTNKTYTWQNGQITFLDDFKMSAFGEGHYITIDKYNIIANFGGRIHDITFNENYSSFTSVRDGDREIVNGVLVF